MIDNPGGGQIAFGPVEGSPSVPQAMGMMLKNIHGHFGAKPQIGKFFRDKNGSVVAVFFKLNPTQLADRPIQGLAMVTASGPRSAAVIYDSADRFSKTLSPMLKTLGGQWNPGGGGSGHRSSRVPALQAMPFPDNSGTISIPTDWRVTVAHGGATRVEGPHGEKVIMGDAINIYDPTTRAGAQGLRMSTFNGKLAPTYAAAPLNGDPGQNFVSCRRQIAHNSGFPMQTISIDSVTTLAQRPREKVVKVVCHLDANTGQGQMLTTAIIRMVNMNPAQGFWVMFIYQDNIPVNLVSEEEATIAAIRKSYKVNESVVIAEDMAFIRSVHALSDEMKREGEQSRDNAGRNGAGFCNYLLDEQVIVDSSSGQHLKGGYDITDRLVKGDPTRFQYVPIQNYLKGIDY